MKLICAMYKSCNNVVPSVSGTTDGFGVAVGLHQGSVLSHYLFLVVIDALTSDVQEET